MSCFKIWLVLVFALVAATNGVDAKKRRTSCLWKGVGTRLKPEHGDYPFTYELNRKEVKFVQTVVKKKGAKFLSWFKKCCWKNENGVSTIGDEPWKVLGLFRAAAQKYRGGTMQLSQSADEVDLEKARLFEDKALHIETSIGILRKIPTRNCRLMDEEFFVKVAKWPPFGTPNRRMMKWFFDAHMSHKEIQRIINTVDKYISAAKGENQKILKELSLRLKDDWMEYRALERIRQFSRSSSDELYREVTNELRGYDTMSGKTRHVDVRGLVLDMCMVMYDSYYTRTKHSQSAQKNLQTVFQRVACETENKKLTHFPIWKISNSLFSKELANFPGADTMAAVLLGSVLNLHPYTGLTWHGYLLGNKVDNTLGGMVQHVFSNIPLAFARLLKFEEESVFPHATTLAFYHMFSAERHGKLKKGSSSTVLGKVCAAMAKKLVNGLIWGKFEFEEAKKASKELGWCYGAGAQAIDLVVEGENAKIEAGAKIVKYSAKAVLHEKTGVRGAIGNEKADEAQGHVDKAVGFLKEMEEAAEHDWKKKMSVVLKKHVFPAVWKEVEDKYKGTNQMKLNVAKSFLMTSWYSDGFQPYQAEKDGVKATKKLKCQF